MAAHHICSTDRLSKRRLWQGLAKVILLFSYLNIRRVKLKDLKNSNSQGEMTPPIFANSFHTATPQVHTNLKAAMPTSDPELELTRCEKKERRREISVDVANTDQFYDDVGLTIKAARMIWEDAHFEVLRPRAYAQVDASAQLHCCVVSGVISYLVKRSSASFARYVLSTEIDRHDFFDAFINKVMATMHEASSTSTRHWRLAPLTYKQYVRLHYRYGQFMHKMQPPFMRVVAHAAQDMPLLEEKTCDWIECRWNEAEGARRVTHAGPASRFEYTE